jgi:hypothetical protein
VADATRKLSATIQLSPGDAYVGGELDVLACGGGFGGSRFYTAPTGAGQRVPGGAVGVGGLAVRPGVRLARP